MSEKLKNANRQIENLKSMYGQEKLDLETKLEKANAELISLKTANNNLAKKLIKAICYIKMSLFSFSLNNEDAELTVQQLSLENKALRSQLGIQNQFS